MKTVAVFLIILYGIAGRQICCCIDEIHAVAESDESHHVSSPLLVHQIFHHHEHSSHDGEGDHFEGDCYVSGPCDHQHSSCNDVENTMFSSRFSSDKSSLEIVCLLLLTCLGYDEIEPIQGYFAVKEPVFPVTSPKVRLHLLFESFLI